jgi:hypothetical protein
MDKGAGTSEMAANMMLATGVLIGTVIVLVAVAVVWYLRDVRQRAEAEDIT